VPTARFFFDYGSGTALWTVEPQESGEHYVDLEQLPVSRALREAVLDLVVRYDSSLNWDYPPDPGPWREAQCCRFNDDARQVLRRLRDELAPDWQIIDSFKELHEDPDLDSYLADPARFSRGRPVPMNRLARWARKLRRRDGLTSAEPTWQQGDRWDPRNPENRERSRRLQRELRAHLMRWDPIGVRDVPQAQDEYDAYISPLLHLLHAGQTEDAVTAYLTTLVEDEIGLDSRPEREQQFAATLVSWWAATTSK